MLGSLTFVNCLQSFRLSKIKLFISHDPALSRATCQLQWSIVMLGDPTLQLLIFRAPSHVITLYLRLKIFSVFQT